MQSRTGPNLTGSAMVPLFGLVLLACFCVPTEAQDVQGEFVKVQYDATKDFSQIIMNPFVLASRKFEELRLGALTGYQGKTATKPKDVALLIFSFASSDQNKYETARKLTITVDGERLPPF